MMVLLPVPSDELLAGEHSTLGDRNHALRVLWCAKYFASSTTAPRENAQKRNVAFLNVGGANSDVVYHTSTKC
jgi:hypothetical protein